MPSAVELRVFKTVDGIRREAIDSLVDDGFFTYGWFKTLEMSKPISLNPFYVTAYNAGKLVAFAPCFHDVADQYFLYGKSVVPFMKRALEVRSRLGIGQDHVLLCYSPWCYRTKIFVARGYDEGLLTRDMIREISAICKREKILFSCFPFVSEFDKNLSKSLSSAGYHKYPMGINYYLDVRWRSFEEYLGSLKRSVRRNVIREKRHCSENEVTIEEMTSFKDLSNELSDLYSNLFAKYHKGEKSFYKASFYESLSDYYAKGNVKLFIAKKKGSLAGFSLYLRHKGTLDGFQSGFNYKLQEKSDFTYFNLCYYAPISWAIQEGIRKVYYRQTTERVKLRRGCKPERAYCFVKCHNRLLNSQISNYIEIKRRVIDIKRGIWR